MTTLLIVMSVVLLSAPTALYPAYTGMRARHLERTVERDAAGVRRGAQSFEVGEGDVALLMVHGFASSPAVFQRMAPALAARGYRCRVMRLPGFGEPLGTTSFDLTLWRNQLDEEVRQLRACSRDVWVIGHSMGGTLALDYVLRGGQAKGVVLVTPLIEVAGERSILLPPRTWFEVGRRIWPDQALIETAFPVDIHEPVPGMDEVRDLHLPVKAYANLFALVDDVAGRAPAIRCPVLMAVAKDDLVVDSRAATAYFSGLGADRKQLLTMPDSGHVAPLDRDWRRLVAVVDQFVQESL